MQRMFVLFMKRFKSMDRSKDRGDMVEQRMSFLLPGAVINILVKPFKY